MDYPNIVLAKFIDRPNRFVAQVVLDQQTVTVHVKNTGRTNILVNGRTVALAPATNPKRKTQYDLVAVKTAKGWINIDSQAPNAVVGDGLRQNVIALPGIRQITLVRPETVYQDARFDFFGTGDGRQPFFLEVKGVTLWHDDVAAFPDAPTIRGEKHVRDLTDAVYHGYFGYLLFLVQIPDIQVVTINRTTQESLATAIHTAQAAGVHVLAYGTHVTPGRMTLGQPIPFDLRQPFDLAQALKEAANQK
ncbi:DNA/RNA nuclease SfsA [Schleiferilactobacillus perolens]|jgi:sugar fermentation stimulation protein A|uniref:Sugar fermentation stimulation protein homolog n=1 Tax=Schleiferilactobacillus perolens DSM 12744 TaxID=1423792 RepID=A0A0R1N2G3_9LACO|nr:DNA/RNA nuclease SfsA [Schleiferilactobacillus perolens]KRL12548.1 sugar fermentation stimulation protein A [Schleiferilactobacillus perolens DSM 12744]MCI2172538.1 DNA/RNA nuclease SfsA [Schleiferilactobacillus perolens]